MKNISELNASLINVFKKLDSGEMDLKLAAELNNTAGKIMSAHKLTLAYHALREEAPEMPFLAAPVAWRKGSPQDPNTIDAKHPDAVRAPWPAVQGAKK